MISIDLTKSNLDIIALHSLVAKLKPNEFCYIKLNSANSIPHNLLNLIHTAVNLSRKVSVSIPHVDVISINIATLFNELKVSSLCIRVKTNPEKYAAVYNYGTRNSGDRDLISSIIHKISECPKGAELALEFNDEIDFRLTGSTIALLHESGVNWVICESPSIITDTMLKNYRDLFDFLRMRRCYKLNVYFDFLSPLRNSWQLQSLNTFSGLREVHIDLSNKCTHSCVFCGLYSPRSQEEIQKSDDPTIVKEIKDFMKMEINSHKALEIINSLPVDVEKIQFGGAGDPLMHEHAVDFIIAARERGFYVEILSNMEYLNEEKIKRLTSLGEKNSKGLNFVVNISGGSPEVFIKTRPKQTVATFQKITNNLTLFSKLKKNNNGKGAWLTILCIVNKNNIDHLLELAEYAVKIEADDIWYKPMELHSEAMRPALPDETDKNVIRHQLKASLEFLDKNQFPILMRDYCEQLIR